MRGFSGAWFRIAFSSAFIIVLCAQMNATLAQPEKVNKPVEQKATSLSRSGGSLSKVEKQSTWYEVLDYLDSIAGRWPNLIAALGVLIALLVAIASLLRRKAPNEQLTEEIRSYTKEINEALLKINAESFAKNPTETKMVVEKVRKNPQFSLLGVVIDEVLSLQEQDKKDEAIEKWLSIANVMKGIENTLAARAWFSIGHLFSEQRKHKDAIKAYNQSIEVNENDETAYNNRGVENYDLKQYDAAIADYDEALRLKPDYAEAYNNRGNANNALGQHEVAIADFEKAISLKPHLSEPYHNRGIAKQDLGQYEAAIIDCDEALHLNPDYVEVYNTRGNVKSDLGLYEAAIADFEKALRLKPDYAEAYNNRGVTKNELGQYEAAIKDFIEARRFKENYAETYFNCGLAYLGLGDINAARRDFEKACDLARKAGNETLLARAKEERNKLDKE